MLLETRQSAFSVKLIKLLSRKIHVVATALPVLYVSDSKRRSIRPLGVQPPFYYCIERKMSSPSSAGSSKRKRTTNLAATIKQSSTADLLQPSSRDASGEDADDSTVQAVTSSKHKKAATSVDSTNPPSKRPRTRSSATTDTVTSNGASVQEADAGAEGTSLRSKRKGRSSSGKDQEDGEVEDSKVMAPPGKGGLQDPVGYHTNPPPTGRAVRIYADGVFDLFHLGHVEPMAVNPRIC